MEKKNKILEIENLSVEYKTHKGTVKAVNQVDLSIAKGETVGLVGETGAGKTTTALSILRLIQEPPGKIAGGKILFEDRNLFELGKKEMKAIRGEKISMIFQDPMTALNPLMTVGDQIAEVVRLHQKCSAAEAQKKAVDMLEMVGIAGERYSEYPHQFSGGMKQRVVIAIALACNPLLLIADEPTTALDVTIQAQVLDMMVKLKKELGTSLLLITHDLGIVAEVCDRVAVMYAGEIVEEGTAQDIFDFCRHPYTIGLFDSIPNLEEDRERLTPIPGMMPDPTDLPQGCNFAPRCRYCTEQCRSGEVKITELSSTHRIRCVKGGVER